MADIGAKINLEGEADFNRALKNINNSAKELSSELKAVKAEFDDSTSAQEKYTKQAGILERQINNSQEKVALLSQKLTAQKDEMAKAAKAVEDATEKYGENSKEVLSAQATYNKLQDGVSKTTVELNKAQAETNKASTELKNLKTASDKAEQSQDDLGDEVKETGEEMDNTKDKSSTFGDVLKANLTSQAIISGIQAVGQAIKAVAEAIVDAVKETVKWADELQTLSTVSGVSTNELQKMEYMANLIDVDIDTITGSMTKLTNNMQTASTGTGAMAESFAKLGINVTNADGSLRDSETVFYEAVDALGQIENATERDALAMDIFGKSAQDLNPMIQAGSETLQAFGQEAVNTGYVLSEEALGNLTAVSDAFDRIEKAGDNAVRNAVAAMAPAILEMAETAIPVVQEFAGHVAALFNGDEDIGTFVQFLMDQINAGVEWLANNIGTVVEMGVDIVVALLDGISSGDMAGQAMTLISNLQDGIANNLPKILEAGIKTVVSLIKGITKPENLRNVITTGTSLLINLVGGIVTAIPELIRAVPTIIQNLVQAIIENLPTILLSGVGIMLELIAGILESIPELIASIPQIIAAIFKAFANADWGGIGRNIMEGIGNGLTSMVKNLVSKVKEIGNTILDGAKRLLGIHSPSRVFRDQIGKMIPAGLSQGIDQAMPAAVKDMENQMDNLVIGASATLNGISAPVGSAVSNNYGGFVINVNAAEGQSANDIAEQVMYRIQNAVSRREAVFA